MRASVCATLSVDSSPNSKKVAAIAPVAVVGVLIEAGTFNTRLGPVWAAMPHAAGSEVTMDTFVDVARFLPQDRRIHRYPGSLTTTPCSEGVNWNLMKARIPVASRQVGAFKVSYSLNARYTQPLNGRVILGDASGGK